MDLREAGEDYDWARIGERYLQLVERTIHERIPVRPVSRRPREDEGIRRGWRFHSPISPEIDPVGDDRHASMRRDPPKDPRFHLRDHRAPVSYTHLTLPTT